LAVTFVELHEPSYVYVGDAVAVGHHERLVFHERAQSLDSPTGNGVQAGVDQVDGPVILANLAAHQVAGGQVHGEAAVERGVVKEVTLDDIAFVTEGNRELLEAV